MGQTFENPPKRQCPDCDVKLVPIKILDSTESGGIFSDETVGYEHVLLAYAAEDAERSSMLHTFPQMGHIQGMLCPKCGRVLMYAMQGG